MERLGRSDVSIDEWQNQSGDFIDHAIIRPCSKLGAAGFPTKALDLIGEDDAAQFPVLRQQDLEGIALYFRGDRTGEKESGLAVVGLRRNDERGPAACLFVSGLRVEAEPDDVSAARNVVPHHTSGPTAGPVSMAAWRLRGVMLRRRVFSLWRWRVTGRMTIEPERRLSSTGEVSARLVSAA